MSKVDQNNTVDQSKIYFNFSNKSTGSTKTDQYDKNTFLKILSAQLSNQDPMTTQDNSQYVAQMAQFSALEQMQNLNTAMTNLLKAQQFSEGTSLVGKEVGIKLDDGSYIKDSVKSVRMESGAVYVVTSNDKVYGIDQVVGVGDLDSGQDSSSTSK